MQTAIPFAEDHEHAAYDAGAAKRCWQILLQTDRVLKRFRARYLGKASPVHFFWEASTWRRRFSGRTAPRHGGGAPNCPDHVMVEAYSHECSSCGFWPGTGPVGEPAFYSYAYQSLPATQSMQWVPREPTTTASCGEFVLPYEVVRTAPLTR